MTGDFHVLKRSSDGDSYQVIRENTTLEEAWNVAVRTDGCLVFEDITPKIKPVVIR